MSAARKARIPAKDPECSAIFDIRKLRMIKTCGVLTVLWNRPVFAEALLTLIVKIITNVNEMALFDSVSILLR